VSWRCFAGAARRLSLTPDRPAGAFVDAGRNFASKLRAALSSVVGFAALRRECAAFAQFVPRNLALVARQPHHPGGS
jgi:hypothetical protein